MKLYPSRFIKLSIFAGVFWFLALFLLDSRPQSLDVIVREQIVVNEKFPHDESKQEKSEEVEARQPFEEENIFEEQHAELTEKLTSSTEKLKPITEKLSSKSRSEEPKPATKKLEPTTEKLASKPTAEKLKPTTEELTSKPTTEKPAPTTEKLQPPTVELKPKAEKVEDVKAVVDSKIEENIQIVIEDAVKKTIEKAKSPSKELENVDKNMQLENVEQLFVPNESSTVWRFSKPSNVFGVEDLGELGNAVTMPKEPPPPGDIKKLFDDGWTNHQFNQYLSDLISVNRTISDHRSDYCKKIEANYSKTLPATSVIIIFHNEAWSTLLRSVHSVLNRSPEHLITEVILVDDCSTMEHLGQPLDDYMAQFPKVKVLHAPTRGGLIKARIMGTMAAKGPVLTFLDSHIETSPGWLEPMLARIAEDPTNVASPVIVSIDPQTFKFSFLSDANNVQIGGFSWRMIFNWHPIPEREKSRKKHPWEPTRTPTIAGGLFSIDKAFFQKLGMYDPDFDIWGAENLELSFKTWMCGGTLEIIPCSVVGHIFRGKSPYKWRTGVNVLRKNSIRLVKVWVDDYAEFYYKRTGEVNEEYGDISNRVQLRKDLNCKSFGWYLKNVYPELFVPGDAIATGMIRSLGLNNKTCLESRANYPETRAKVLLYNCNGTPQQIWMYSRDGELRRDDFCLDHNLYDTFVSKCHGGKGNQHWEFKQDVQQLYHKVSKKCLAVKVDSKALLMEVCDSAKETQKWHLEKYDSSKLKSL